MKPEQVIEMARGVISLSYPAEEAELLAFAQLVRNAALEEAKEVCRQVVRETNKTLTWEGCSEIQQALEREKT